MARLAVVLCAATVGLAAVSAAAAAGPGAGPAASAVVLQAADIPGATVSSQKGGSPGAGVTQYLRVLRLAKPYGASKYLVVENIAVVVPTETLGAVTFDTLVTAFSTAKARKTLETGLAAAAFKAPGKAKTTKPAPKIVYTHELHHAVALGESGIEISFTAAQGAKRIDTTVVVFRIGQVIEELVASGTAAQTAEADTLALGNLVVTRAKAALVPVSTAPPVVSGTAQQGQTLTAAPGSWSNVPTGYAYQWQHCDAAGANCADIPNATGSTYAVQPGDVGTTLRVTVSASNSGGAAAAVPSAMTAVVS